RTQTRPVPMRRTFGFALPLAAGLLWLAPGSAHAQSSYGYDSWFYNLPTAEAYYYNSGYGGLYTDRSTASFANGTMAPYRAVAPYNAPPFGTFNRTDPLRLSPGVATTTT